VFDALDDCLDPALHLPVGGVKVSIPFPTIREALGYKRWYADLTSGRPTAPIDPVAVFIGEIPEGVTDREADRCAWTALAYFGAGPRAAEQIWQGEAVESIAAEPVLVDGPWGPYDPRPGAYGLDDPGGGPPDPTTGIRRWYNTDGPNSQGAPTVTWADLLARWNSVVSDFQQYYHLDLEALLDDRHIGWLEARIAGLQEITGSRVQTITALSKGE
jgi:hypothetical protein